LENKLKTRQVITITSTAKKTKEGMARRCIHSSFRAANARQKTVVSNCGNSSGHQWAAVPQCLTRARTSQRKI